MTLRFCPRCAEEVEDTGGFCLLGHKLSLDAPTASIQELREEVERSFEEARLQISAVMQSDDAARAERTLVEVSTAASTGVSRPAAPLVAAPPTRPAPPSTHTDTSETSPMRLRRTPPPPPPPPVERPKPRVGEWVDEDIDMTTDPIAAFAPPPRMDWGPDRGTAKPRKGLRRLRTSEA